MPGTQEFTYLYAGKETAHGTPVAPTRRLAMDGTGVLDVDPGLTLHEREAWGRRSEVRRATARTEDVALSAKTAEGISFDDLVIPASQLKGGLTGTGAGADKTWAATPAMTGNNGQESYSLDVGDDTQNWRVQYAMMPSFKLSAAQGELTQLDTTWFGQRAIKGAAATPALVTPVTIPAEWWTLKFATTFAGLAGASVQTNFLRSWSLLVRTGLTWEHYLDGNLYGSQHVEGRIGGDLAMTVDSTALAVSEGFDKWLVGTTDYVRLKATGPALGGSAYSVQFDVPILWTKVKPIDSATRSGVNQYSLAARVVDDGTNSIAMTLVCSLAALP